MQPRSKTYVDQGKGVLGPVPQGKSTKIGSFRKIKTRTDTTQVSNYLIPGKRGTEMNEERRPIEKDLIK